MAAVAEPAHDPELDSEEESLDADTTDDELGVVGHVTDYLGWRTSWRRSAPEEFLKFAVSKEDPNKIYYEDYVYKLCASVNKHTEKMYKPSSHKEDMNM